MRRLFRTAMAIVLSVAGVEGALQIRTAIKDAYPDPSRMRDLERAYAPFAELRLHPHYQFFYPMSPAERVSMGNSVCSIDAAGFREPGPAHAGGRKLAVMLGGSAVFGYYASSNRATITSYLNRMQDQYFFVNAGVVSWNSTQELFRLTLEIWDLRPQLVIAFGGANDAALSDLTNPTLGTLYPPGTPSNFDVLEQAVQGGWRWRVPPLFPELRRRILPGTIRRQQAAPPRQVVAAAATRYRTNLRRMATSSRARGARFMAVFQPVASLHRNLAPPATPFAQEHEVAMFHDAVTAEPFGPVEFHDFSAVFDRHFTAIPVAAADIADDTVFVDNVHLFDPGNELVARELLSLIGGPAAEDSSGAPGRSEPVHQ